MIKDIREIKTCPDCGTENLSYLDDKQQVVCRECGLIFEPLTPEEEEKFERTHNIKSSK